jgi:hypothetical protein
MGFRITNVRSSRTRLGVAVARHQHLDVLLNTSLGAQAGRRRKWFIHSRVTPHSSSRAVPSVSASTKCFQERACSSKSLKYVLSSASLLKRSVPPNMTLPKDPTGLIRD